MRWQVDWLLTVPLLLIEIVLVMGLPEAETVERCTTLGVSSALMIAFGYPGENSGIDSTRWTFWMVSMCPFCYIVYTLFIGLKEAQDKGFAEAVPDADVEGYDARAKVTCLRHFNQSIVC